jgi:ribosomal protein L37E
MGQSTFCARCGLEAPLDEAVKACAACGYVVFVPARYLEWEASLSENDRKFLKSIRVAIT